MSPDASADASPSGAASVAPSAAPPVLDQAWATAELTDVATGETFRLADLAGRPIILETMAIWCPKCLTQQGTVHEALTELGDADIEYVVVDVDPSETAEALAEYRAHHGFVGRYVVADTTVARALAAEFGDNILNPPSTPIVFVGEDGRVTLTEYGQKSADVLVALAREHGA